MMSDKNTEVKTARQPIAVEMVDMAEKLACRMEKLASYTFEKLAPVSHPTNPAGKEESVSQEWPDLFSAVGARLERIGIAADEIQRQLDAVEI